MVPAYLKTTHMNKMYKVSRLLLVLFAIVNGGVAAHAQFTAGRLVVLQVGDGSAALTNAANPVFLKEFTTAGAAGVTVTVPITGAERLTVSGTSTSDGQITLSQNGQYISVAGYDAAVGTASVTGTSAAAVNRIVNTADASGGIVRAVSTNAQYSGNNFRSAVRGNSADFWGAGGNSGTYYLGTTAPAATVQNTTTNTRVVNIINGNLYYATGSGTSGIYGFSGTPTTASAATLLIATGTGSSPYGFAINAAGNVAYVADDRTNGSGGVQKWTFNGTVWSLAYTFSPATNVGARGLAVDFSAASPILYATTTANTLVSFTDVGAASAATLLATAPTNTAFRGLSFAPAAAPVIPTVALSVSSNSGTEAGTTAITVTATASAAVSGNQTVDLTVGGTNITAGDYTLSNTVITIPNGSTTGTVTFTVTDDALVEGPETAVLTIGNPSAGIVLGSPASQNIDIADNDVALPTVSLSVSANTASEAAMTLVTVTATASAPVSGNQTVALAVGGAGITANDYVLSGTTITLLNGQTTGSVTFKVRNDAETEGPETAVLTIGTPSAGIALGSPVAQNITITDNACQPLIRKSTATSANGAEISAYDSASKRVFTVAGPAMEYYSLSNAGILGTATNMPFGFTSAGNTILPNSVAVKNGIVAVSYAIVGANNVQQPGAVAFYNAATAAYISHVTVGYLPDMLAFTPDGSKLLTANEGEPNSYGQGTSFDPEGSVSIIDISGGVAAATVQTVGFAGFNAQAAALRAAGVRIYGPGATVAQDLEPEYIAFSADGSKAFVTLQENNAIAELDMATAAFTQILPLGLKNHSLAGNGLDASDQDGGINIQQWPVRGMYQPDAIASITVGGTTYYITANEGDARAYTGFSEEVRVGATGYVLDPTVFPNAATLKANANLGRLQLSNATGDTDGDGDFDEIHALGARSFTIWNAAFAPIFDSGDQLEQITAAQNPAIFNSDGAAASFDGRSDNKGPEPEAVVAGVVNGVPYAFVGSERTGDILVYDISNPAAPVFLQYIDHPADLGVEGLTFVPAHQSPTGKALIIATAEVSRTVTVYEFGLVSEQLAMANSTVTAQQVMATSYGDCAGLVARVVQSGASPIGGTVTARVWVQPTVPTAGGQPFVQRHYEITPATGAATATGRVTLYFTQVEFDNFNNDPASALDLPNGPADAAGISSLRVIKYPGASSDGSGLPGTYTGTPVVIDPADTDIVWNAAAGRWEVSLDVTGFSGFIVQTTPTVLPVRLLDWTVQAKGNDAEAQWTVAVEVDHAYYEVESSTDGIHFASVGRVAPQVGNASKRYSIVHANAAALGSKMYYRLKMVSVAGAVSYSSTALVRFGIKQPRVSDVLPNPTAGRITVTTVGESQRPIYLRVMDMGGRLLEMRSIGAGQTATLDLTNQAAGLYFIEAILHDGGKQHFKLMKR
jgi:hypothetical protein